MAQEMTMRGKVFKAYAEAVVARHGFGSTKMVEPGSPDFIRCESMRAQKLSSRAGWAKESTNISVAEYEAAVAGGEEAERWLIENGWLREYSFSTHNTVAGTGGKVLCNFRSYTRIGVTPKGWAVANKYLNA